MTEKEYCRLCPCTHPCVCVCVCSWRAGWKVTLTQLALSALEARCAVAAVAVAALDARPPVLTGQAAAAVPGQLWNTAAAVRTRSLIKACQSSHYNPTATLLYISPYLLTSFRQSCQLSLAIQAIRAIKQFKKLEIIPKCCIIWSSK